ncbi:MAG: hypothetical protein ACK4UU_04785, partial [Fimbriimonadales bacterium]
YGVVALSGLCLFALYLATPAEPAGAPLHGKRLILGVGEHALERAEYIYRSPSGEWTLAWRPTDALAVDPIVALNPIQVAFTSEGTMLRGNSVVPTTLTLRTLNQSPAPLRLERTHDGYALRNTSENLTVEALVVKGYPRSSTLAEGESADDATRWASKPLPIAPTLPPNQSVSFPYEPSMGYLVHGSAKVATEQLTEEVEIWLFYP